MALDGRAATPDDKRQVLERILRAWQSTPHLRLGQLLVNAVDSCGAGVPTLFYAEDDPLATVIELYASHPGRRS